MKNQRLEWLPRSKGRCVHCGAQLGKEPELEVVDRRGRSYGSVHAAGCAEWFNPVGTPVPLKVARPVAEAA